MFPVSAAAVLAIAIAATAARADDESAPSFHIGGSIALVVLPEVQLQVEWPRWFLGAEAGFGFGGWRVSGLALLKAGYIFEAETHPYLAIGGGIGWAYDTENASGSGLALSAEAGLMFGHQRSWGRIIPFVELPIATWSAVSTSLPPYTWKPGIGSPLIGVKLLY